MPGAAPGADPTDLTIESYDRETDRYLAQSSPPSDAVRGYLDAFAAGVPGGHVLELGSGPGWDADYLESKGLVVDRTDATPRFVELLRAAGHPARLLDARSDDYGGPFDGVFADAVLLHLSRPALARAVHTARRATRAGGVLGITLKEGHGAAWSTVKLGRPRHFTYWRAQEIADALADAGWTQIEVQHFSGRTEPWLFVLARADNDPDVV